MIEKESNSIQSAHKVASDPLKHADILLNKANLNTIYIPLMNRRTKYDPSLRKTFGSVAVYNH